MMRYVLGVDPGKTGSFVLINQNEEVIEVWDMPYHGSTLSAQGVAEIYQHVCNVAGMSAGQRVKPEIFIEKAFTKPGDALSIEKWGEMAKMRESAANLAHSWLKHKDGVQVLKSDWDALFGDLLASVKATVWADGYKYRPDGRVGNFNYAKAAGILEVCAAFGLSYTLVSPATWCPVMHKGADGKLKAKDKSRQVLERRWPELAKKGSPLFRPKGRKVDDGRMDAFLIAVYGLSV